MSFPAISADARWSFKAHPSDHAKGPMTLLELQRLVKNSFVSFDELISDGGSQWIEIGDVAVLEEAVRWSFSINFLSLQHFHLS